MDVAASCNGFGDGSKKDFSFRKHLFIVCGEWFDEICFKFDCAIDKEDIRRNAIWFEGKTQNNFFSSIRANATKLLSNRKKS